MKLLTLIIFTLLISISFATPPSSPCNKNYLEVTDTLGCTIVSMSSHKYSVMHTIVEATDSTDKLIRDHKEERIVLLKSNDKLKEAVQNERERVESVKEDHETCIIDKVVAETEVEHQKDKVKKRNKWLAGSLTGNGVSGGIFLLMILL